jgi:two-component system chemotaxis response regulator CheY
MRKRRILVIEDNEIIAIVIKQTLIHMGGQLDVRLADSAEEGLQLFLKNGPFDLMIVGYHLPGKTGIELIRELKPVLGATLWILISGSSSKELEEEVMSLGGYNYLEEPFTLAELKNIVWEALAMVDVGSYR